jgi:hypothetical protein
MPQASAVRASTSGGDITYLLPLVTTPGHLTAHQLCQVKTAGWQHRCVQSMPCAAHVRVTGAQREPCTSGDRECASYQQQTCRMPGLQASCYTVWGFGYRRSQQGRKQGSSVAPAVAAACNPTLANCDSVMRSGNRISVARSCRCVPCFCCPMPRAGGPSQWLLRLSGAGHACQPPAAGCSTKYMQIRQQQYICAETGEVGAPHSK